MYTVQKSDNSEIKMRRRLIRLLLQYCLCYVCVLLCSISYMYLLYNHHFLLL